MQVSDLHKQRSVEFEFRESFGRVMYSAALQLHNA